MLCIGVDLAPALSAQNINALETIEMTEASCNRGGGAAPIPTEARAQLDSIGKILNIDCIAEGTRKEATIICQRSSNCPRKKHRLGKQMPQFKSKIDEICAAIVGELN